MDDCIFCKIRDRQVPKEFTYEDDDVMVFPDINPVKPVHLLIISKKHFWDLSVVRDDALMAKLMLTVQEMVKENDLDKYGYRVLINGGGAQAIMHLHIHLFGPMDQTTLL